MKTAWIIIAGGCVALAAAYIAVELHRNAKSNENANNYNVILRADSMDGTRLQCRVMASVILTNSTMKSIESLALAHETYALVHHWVDNQPRRISVHSDGYEIKTYTVTGDADITAVLWKQEK